MSLQPGNLALPFMQAAPDALTAATPLGLLKFQQQATELLQLLLGNTGGSLGETSAGIILLCGLFLAARRLFDWRIPVGILGTALLFAGIVYLLAPESQPLPVFHVLSGGLAFGAVFMATDPVTSPMAPLATWIYAIGIGALVVLIRLWGGLPEGVMYAILLWNAATPLLNRVIQPTPLGRGREARTGGAETQR
jgi:electron transport complex protein RnfD